MRRNPRGSILIAIVFAMLILALMAVAGVSMLVNQTHVALNVQALAESHALASGAVEYVTRQLADDPDWSDGVNLQSSSLGGHPFSAAFSEQDRNQLKVTVQSQVTFGDSVSTKNYTFKVWRLPKAFYYGFFWANGDSHTLSLSGVTLRGNAYVGGSVSSQSSTYGGGTLYYKKGEIVVIGKAVPDDGSPLREVHDPQPAIPAYNTSTSSNRYENAVVNDYDPAIQAAHNSVVTDGDACPTVNSDLAISTNFTVNGTTTCRDISIESGANVTISGHGRLLAWRDVYLQENPTTGTRSQCIYNDEVYRTSDGGCKKLSGSSSGTVWSNQQADNAQAAAASMCASLGTGWALPTSQQLIDARDGGALGHINFSAGSPVASPPAGNLFWSSTPGSAGQFNAVDMATNGAAAVSQDATLPGKVLCVASASSANLGKTTVTPSGGGIEIIAGRSILKSDDRKGLDVQKGTATNERVTLFAANATLSGLANLPLDPKGQMFFSGSGYGTVTQFDQPLLVASRNLRLEAGAVVSNDGVAYVRNFSNVAAEQNFLDVRDSGTVVDGSLISTARRDPNLILSNAAVTGIVYANGDNASGRALITGATIHGGLIANLILSDTLSSSTIDNTDPAYYPTSNIPDGFSGSASIEPGSWDGI